MGWKDDYIFHEENMCWFPVLMSKELEIYDVSKNNL